MPHALSTVQTPASGPRLIHRHARAPFGPYLGCLDPSKVHHLEPWRALNTSVFFLRRDRPPILGSVTGQPPSVATDSRRMEGNRRQLEFHSHSSQSPLTDPELAQNSTPDHAR